MLQISFMACSLLLGRCEEKQLTFLEDPATISAFACAFQGQVEIAKWTRTNPNWCIAPGGFKCRPADMMAKA